MGYLEKRNKDVLTLHNIYNSTIPKNIRDLVEIPEVLKMNGISAHCGVDYTRLGFFKFYYSKLDHDVGIALIMSKFGQDIKAVTSAMLHDISSTAFAHVYNFMKEDYRFEKNSHKINAFDTIVDSEGLFKYFIDNEISIMDVYDCSKYPLSNNLTPKLSADRLEYILENGLNASLRTADQIANMYNDLTVAKNENFNEEFCFQTVELAEDFCKLSIEVGKIFNSYEQKLSMQLLADILSLMIKRGIITEDDLYKYSDKVIMDMGVNCNDERVVNAWRAFLSLDKVYTSFNKPENKYSAQIISKRRYVDPLIKTDTGLYRISKLSGKCKDAIYDFLVNNTDMYAYIENDF